MELIFLIAIIIFVCKKAGVALDLSNQVEVLDKNKGNWGAETYQAPRQATRQDSAKAQVEQSIAKAKQQAQKKASELYEQMNLSGYAPKTEKKSAMQQVHEGRVEARMTTIADRAKTNTNANKADITLETMEAEHNHSERVSAATHDHPEDVMPESMLGSIEDLMVKGYDGNLCFERDFIGEGLDMISRFTVPSDMPDFS